MPKQFFAFSPPIIRQMVPDQVTGIYLLARYHNAELIAGYVGRSDTCLRRRLTRHNLLGQFDYFTFQITEGVTQAFVEEAGWWHFLRNEGFLVNSLHPAIPGHSELLCPYCDTAKQFQVFLDQMNQGFRKSFIKSPFTARSETMQRE